MIWKEAAQALDHALAELDRLEAEQREAARRKRVIFLEAAVEQHTLRSTLRPADR